MGNTNTTLSTNIPQAVTETLRERSGKLRSNDFPQPVARDLANVIDQVIGTGCVEDRFLLDLAIVTTRVAHAFDREGGAYCFQEKFRKEKYLKPTIVQREVCLKDRNNLLKKLNRGRKLTATERNTFLDMHRNCRKADGKEPILAGEDMEKFLDAQNVRELDTDVGDAGFHGISSYDGTVVYVVLRGSEEITVPHELEHNIRRFVESTRPLEQARLVSPQKDSSLKIDGVQCEAGFVSEYRYHKSQPEKLSQDVPQELISPFSARWNRNAFR